MTAVPIRTHTRKMVAAMNIKFEAFIAEVTSAPQFVAALETHPQLKGEMDALERGLRHVDQMADEDPCMVESFDQIVAIIERGDLSIKQRLIQIGNVARSLRDAGRTVN
jgi:hypothetical protein